MTSTPLDGIRLSPQATAAGTPPSLTTPDGLNIQAILEAKAKQEKEQKLISWVNTQYDMLRNQRMMFERQWFINMAFTAGRQNIAPVTVAGSGFKLVSPKAPPWRVRMVINKIRVAVRTECAKLTSSKPIPVVLPATTEDEDYAASRVAESILKSYFATDDFNASLRSWVWWGSVTGNGVLKSYWNPNEKDDRATVEVPPNPQMVAAKQAGAPVPPQLLQPTSQPAMGKICVERINPFHFFVPDLMEEELDRQPYVMHVSTKSPDFVKQYFGVTVTPDSKASNSLLETAVLSPMGASNNQFDSVLVKEVWAKPGHPLFPEGGMVTVVGNHCVQHKETWDECVPFPEYPFYKYEGIATGGYYTESVVTDLIPIQKEYNRTKSQIIEIKNMMGKPKIMAFRGSINPRQVNSEPGQAILVTPGFPMPTPLPAVEAPATMQVELDRLNSDFDDISGQHEITRGNTPSQVTSGTAIAYLQEQDDTKLAYQVAGIERATAKLGKHYLKYAAKYWQDGRTVKIVGRDGAFESEVWQKNTMEGNTDVIVQAGSGIPESKAAKRAFVTDLMTQGFIDPSIGMEILDLSGMDKVIEDFLVDKRQAQRENLKMASAPPEAISPLVNPPVGPDGTPLLTMDGQPGQVGPDGVSIVPWTPQSPMPVNSYDNHEAHIHFHNQFRKTQQYELLHDDIKKMFELHVQTHQMAIMMPQMGQAGIVSDPSQQGMMNPNAPVDPGMGGEAQPDNAEGSGEPTNEPPQ